MEKGDILKRYREVYESYHTDIYNKRVIKAIEEGDYEKVGRNLKIGFKGVMIVYTILSNFFHKIKEK